MKKAISILILAIIASISVFSMTFADTANIKTDSINQWNDRTGKMWLEEWKNWWTGWFFDTWKVWEAWVQWLLFAIAKDLKNVFIAVAVIYMFVLVLRLFFWQWSDDDIKKLRIWLLWTTIWIVLMQMSYTAVIAIYDKSVWAVTAKALSDAVIIPIIRLLEVVTSFIFMAIAIMAFFKIVWAGWNEEWYKKWVNSIINAIVWFILVKISARLVYSMYWEVKCDTTLLWTQQCTDPMSSPNLSETAKIIASVLKYMTWFIGIITIILIIWAWFLLVTSSWNEDKSKKAKSIIKFIAIWIILIVSSVAIFRFMVGMDVSWMVWVFKK